jgi:hypothetical protein
VNGDAVNAQIATLDIASSPKLGEESLPASRASLGYFGVGPFFMQQNNLASTGLCLRPDSLESD